MMVIAMVAVFVIGVLVGYKLKGFAERRRRGTLQRQREYYETQAETVRRQLENA